jgi:3-hydroxyacyl-[acyl-carrier-protein] dehydratase
MTSEAQTCQLPLRVPRTHPALAGHFPGNPIVPGVVLVDHAINAAEKWLGRSVLVRGINQVKFAAPLAPEEDCVLELTVEPQAQRLRFTIRREDDLIAQGIVLTTNGSRD